MFHPVVQGVCHRDLKLENTLLDGRPAPRLKICDFGYSKVNPLTSSPHQLVKALAILCLSMVKCWKEAVCSKFDCSV